MFEKPELAISGMKIKLRVHLTIIRILESIFKTKVVSAGKDAGEVDSLRPLMLGV